MKTINPPAADTSAADQVDAVKAASAERPPRARILDRKRRPSQPSKITRGPDRTVTDQIGRGHGRLGQVDLDVIACSRTINLSAMAVRHKTIIARHRRAGRSRCASHSRRTKKTEPS